MAVRPTGKMYRHGSGNAEAPPPCFWRIGAKNWCAAQLCPYLGSLTASNKAVSLCHTENIENTFLKETWHKSLFGNPLTNSQAPKLFKYLQKNIKITHYLYNTVMSVSRDCSQRDQGGRGNRSIYILQYVLTFQFKLYICLLRVLK